MLARTQVGISLKVYLEAAPGAIEGRKDAGDICGLITVQC